MRHVGQAMIFQQAVFSLLRPASRGRLEVVLPDGRREVFGGLGGTCRARMEIKDWNFFRRCVVAGPIGFAESYMAGEWETPGLAEVIAFFILNSEESRAMETPGRSTPPLFNLIGAWHRLQHRRRPNSPRLSRANIRDHYDLSNDFFRLWLDPTMTYSCALFEREGMSLEEAQRAKYEALCRRLRIRPEHHVLEIGTGWGGFALHAAGRYGCRVTTTTISREQYEEASRRVEAAGLSQRVRLLEKDYRELRGFYDRIVSIEMLEAVGDEYVDGYFEACARLMKPEGLLGLQAILCPDQQYEILRRGVDFIQKHIFPGSLLMSLGRILRATGRTRGLNLFEFFDMGPHYARTLALWNQAFQAARPQVLELGFDEAFCRKWHYYLSYCEAAFATRNITVAQLVFTNPRNLALNTDPPATDFAYAKPARRCAP